MSVRSRTSMTTEDVVYHVADGEPLLATIYRPVGQRLFPGVVSVHGGRWCSESRLTNAVIDQALADSGIVVMAIDFRMPPVARYPIPVADINLAIRWLKRHAPRYGIARAVLGGIGTSSGGHQLLLNASKPTNPCYASWEAAEFSDVDASLAYVVCVGRSLIRLLATIMRFRAR